MVLASGKGTFGPATPGKLVDAFRVEQLDPLLCTSYCNVVVLCGINSIRNDRVDTRAKIKGVFDLFRSKIDQIHMLNRRAKLFVCAVLPTKSATYNRKATHFNGLLEDMAGNNFNITIVGPSVFESYLDPDTGLLSERFSFRNDQLHLTPYAASRLATTIKTAIFARKKKRVDGRKFSAAVSSGTDPR